MPVNRSRLYTFTVLVQVALVIFLGVYVGWRYTHPTEVLSITPVSPSNVRETPSPYLGHLYEYGPGRKEYSNQPWLEGYELYNTINADLLHERFEYATSAPPRTYRIMTLGDSWAYGQYVSTADNFSEQLEDSLNQRLSCGGIDGFEVINLGVPGYDISYAAERFRIRGAKYDPDFIIWLFIPNDFNEMRDVIEPLRTQWLERLQSQPINEVYDDRIGPRDLYASDEDIRKVVAFHKAIEEMRERYTLEEIRTYHRAFLERFAAQLSSTQTLFYTLPDILSYAPGDLELLRELAAEHGQIETYESRMSFGDGDQLPDFHPSPTGHQRIAADLMEQQLRRSLGCQESVARP